MKNTTCGENQREEGSLFSDAASPSLRGTGGGERLQSCSAGLGCSVTVRTQGEGGKGLSWSLCSPSSNSSLGGCVRTGSAIPKLCKPSVWAPAAAPQGDVLAAVCRAWPKCRAGDFTALWGGELLNSQCGAGLKLLFQGVCLGVEQTERGMRP